MRLKIATIFGIIGGFGHCQVEALHLKFELDLPFELVFGLNPFSDEVVGDISEVDVAREESDRRFPHMDLDSPLDCICEMEDVALDILEQLIHLLGSWFLLVHPEPLLQSQDLLKLGFVGVRTLVLGYLSMDFFDVGSLVGKIFLLILLIIQPW